MQYESCGASKLPALSVNQPCESFFDSENNCDLTIRMLWVPNSSFWLALILVSTTSMGPDPKAILHKSLSSAHICRRRTNLARLSSACRSSVTYSRVLSVESRKASSWSTQNFGHTSSNPRRSQSKRRELRSCVFPSSLITPNASFPTPNDSQRGKAKLELRFVGCSSLSHTKFCRSVGFCEDAFQRCWWLVFWLKIACVTSERRGFANPPTSCWLVR